MLKHFEMSSWDAIVQQDPLESYKYNPGCENSTEGSFVFLQPTMSAQK